MPVDRSFQLALHLAIRGDRLPHTALTLQLPRSQGSFPHLCRATLVLCLFWAPCYFFGRAPTGLSVTGFCELASLLTIIFLLTCQHIPPTVNSRLFFFPLPTLHIETFSHRLVPSFICFVPAPSSTSPSLGGEKQTRYVTSKHTDLESNLF